MDRANEVRKLIYPKDIGQERPILLILMKRTILYQNGRETPTGVSKHSDKTSEIAET